LKSLKTRPKPSVINVRGLVLIYMLLCLLTVVFSRTFFSGTLENGQIPGALNRIVFFTIPAVLLVFLAVSVVNLLRDVAARRIGSKFKIRLLAYFIVVVAFAAAPPAIVTTLAVKELTDFWRSINAAPAAAAAHDFAMDTFSLRMEKLEKLVQETNFSPWMGNTGGRAAPGPLPEGVLAVQDFRQNAGVWESAAFAGDETLRLSDPPVLQPGPAGREMPRDEGLVRYALYPREFPREEVVRIITYSLGEGFDQGYGAIENEIAHFEIIDSLRNNMRPLLIFYYGVFFFPTLLMTVIIAISFTRRVTQPLVELTEATRRVAEGDFSIQILARRGDELGVLIRSFNSMVQDLEKSRAALVRSEKISIWQNMAQQLAHEIKNPLTPIKLSAERVLRRWQNDPDRVGEILESSMLAILREVEGLSTLLNEFRTLSLPMEPSRAWTNFREAVEETISPYGSSHPGIRFDTGHVEADVSVRIDKHRLGQVLTNLIVNAIDAMDGIGLIEIRTDLVQKRESRYCRVSFRDTGKGIADQNAPLVFTPYFTTKESGTGLGLPIVERIVNDHGGAIWFNSAEGTGTTFFIDLPIDVPGAGVPAGSGE
jgi:nitrogen fixation/metabolism regulation signal transduction histidine kinase